MRRYGSANGRAPVVFVPSLINPPQVLDLSASRSMLRAMVASGHDAWLIDWGTPGQEDTTMGLAEHVTERLLPLLDHLSEQPILVGYCLGGTLTLGAAMLRSARAVATVASPWQFDGFPDTGRAEIATLWRGARHVCEQLGYIPMEVLQSGFWALDPARTIRKYAAFAEMEGGSDAARAFMAVEDWANGGSPLTYAAGRELFDDFYGANASGEGRWTIDGSRVDPASLTCPTLSVRSTSDRIVPAAAAPELREMWDLGLGHVGMMVGGRARDMLWSPLSRWLSSHGG